MDSEEPGGEHARSTLPDVLNALNHPLRLRVIAALRHERKYVSALARELGMSRPLLYMHLERLEKAGLVAGSLELSAEGRAIKWYSLRPFDISLTPEVVEAVVADMQASSDTGTAQKDDDND